MRTMSFSNVAGRERLVLVNLCTTTLLWCSECRKRLPVADPHCQSASYDVYSPFGSRDVSSCVRNDL